MGARSFLCSEWKRERRSSSR